MKNAGHVLLVPFHFPPIQGSTGASRSWEFARWLPDFGWRVTVLTANERAYPQTSAMPEPMPEDVQVIRAFALDAKRHLSLFGRYLRVTEIPDRWSTWIIGGVISGLRRIRADRPDVMYSTYPIVSAHVIASILHRMTGVPWIAEFRDPMVEETFPPEGGDRRRRLRLERRIFRSAAHLVTVTPGARAYYEDRSGREAGYVREIPNGINASLLRDVSQASRIERPSGGKLTLLHSGILYPDVRDPHVFLEAVAELLHERVIDSEQVEIVFRGSGSSSEYSQQAAALGLDGLVHFRDAISYEKAYEEMRQADGLMVLQGASCNRQVPAKLYECCALRKPVLCLADPRGDTGTLFSSLGLGESVALEDADAIKRRLREFLDELRSGRPRILDDRSLEGLSRRKRTEELASLLAGVKNGSNG